MYPPAMYFMTQQLKDSLKAPNERSKPEEVSGKEHTVKLKIPFDYHYTEKTFTQEVKVFDDGTPEDWCKWRINFSNLVSLNGYKKNAEQQLTLAYALLQGKTRDIFVQTKNGLESKNVIRRTSGKTEFTSRQIMDAVIFDITKHVFNRENGSWNAAYC